jgi:hypothetical protein
MCKLVFGKELKRVDYYYYYFAETESGANNSKI